MTRDEVKAMSDDELSVLIAQRWFGFVWMERGGYKAFTDPAKPMPNAAPARAETPECSMPYFDVPRCASDPHLALDLLFRVQAEAQTEELQIVMHYDETGWLEQHFKHCAIVWLGEGYAIDAYAHDPRKAFARAVAEAAARIERSNDG